MRVFVSVYSYYDTIYPEVLAVCATLDHAAQVGRDHIAESVAEDPHAWVEEHEVLTEES